MNRGDFQQLAELRLEDARVLFAAGRYAAAYYLCGYAVECGLKACIARQIRQYEYPPSRNYSRELFTYELKDLIRYAELRDSLEAQMSASLRFRRNWEIVSAWTETSRYDGKLMQEAQDLVEAVAEPQHGVLEWIRLHW